MMATGGEKENAIGKSVSTQVHLGNRILANLECVFEKTEHRMEITKAGALDCRRLKSQHKSRRSRFVSEIASFSF